MTPLEKPPVFILSSPRSGSTWLFNKLREELIPSTFNPPSDSCLIALLKQKKLLTPFGASSRETSIREFMNMFFQTKGAHKKIDQQKTLNIALKEAFTPQDLVRIIAEQYSLDRPNDVLLEKSPIHIFYQKEIRSLFPNAKFLYLVRDPRDVVASLKNRPWASHNLVSNAIRWNKENSLIVPDKRSMIVHYEDICNAPHIHFEKMIQFIDPEAEIPSMEHPATHHSHQVKDYTNKWKQNLSYVDREVEVVENICKKQMKRFGYALQGKKKKDKKFYATYFHYWLDDMITGTSRKIT